MKITILVSVLWDALAACNTSHDAAIENEKIVRSMFDAFNRHDWKAMTEFYGDTASFLDPSFGTFDVKKSRIETATKYAEMQKMFPDLHDEVVTLFSQGDKVALEFISTSMRGDQKFTLPICTIFTIQNRKIVRDATYYNNCQE